MSKAEGVLQTLTSIYSRYRDRYSNNSDSNQMCCMWSTSNPPDILSETDQVADLEDAFNIQLSEDDAVELYDMLLDEAAKEIEKIINNQ